MRIAMFTDTYPPEINGVSSSAHTLVNALREKGHEVLVVTTNHFINKYYFDKKENIVHLPGLRIKAIFDYRLANPWLNPLVKTVDEVVAKFKPDVIHNQTEWGIALIGQKIASKHNIPIVYTYHTMWEDYAYYVTGEHFNRASRAILRWYSKYNISKCQEFVTPSIKTKDYMRSIGINNYINVIPTGIDFSLFKKDEQILIKANKMRKKLGYKESDKILLVLGRIASEKSIDIVIKGFASLKKKYPGLPTKLLIVGGGPIIDELKVLVEKLNIMKDVKFLGAKKPKEVPIYYQLSDLYCSASLTETQGLTYMEAMASSLICLSRFDSNLINVIVDNKTGFLFHDENDFAAIARHILTLSNKQRQEIINNALALTKEYSVEKFYERIIRVYERAIRKNW